MDKYISKGKVVLAQDVVSRYKDNRVLATYMYYRLVDVSYNLVSDLLLS